MTSNIGTPDRTLRIVLGAALILAALLSGWPVFEATLPRLGAVLVGMVLIGTAVVRFCPLYQLLGVQTCRR